MALTYFSITTSYIPVFIYNGAKHTRQVAATGQTQVDGSQVNSDEPAVARDKVSVTGAILQLLLLAAVAPFLSLGSGISGLISLFIIFIGLKQAWRMTGRPEILINGPVRLGGTGSFMTCLACSAEIPELALSCPQCRRLTNGAKLEDLAGQARAAWRVGKFAEERALWEQSLALLPEDTVQHRSIQARIDELDKQAQAAHASGDGWKKASMGIGPALLALGIVISIYIHEMGHVACIRRYGLPASAPMFIPGLGAFIQLRGVRLPPIPDARVGLAGPVYGLGAALAALGIYEVTHVRIWGVIANFGAVINLVNLIPVWQLDGSRACTR